MRDPNNPKHGFIRLRGNLTATQTANFTALTSDVTDSFGPTEQPALSRELSDADVAALGRTVISKQALPPP